MTEKKGEVVYRRPKAGYVERDPDNWEDFVVCNAYDKAVDATLSHMSEVSVHLQDQKEQGIRGDYDEGRDRRGHEKVGFVKEMNSLTPHHAPESGDSKPSKHFPGSANIKKWKPEDKCLALYSGDGLYYKSKIVSLNEADRSCLVEFDGYGNREVVDIGDIRSERRQGNGRTLSIYSSTGSLSSTEGSDVTQSRYQNCTRKKKRTTEPKHFNFAAPSNFNHSPMLSMPPPVFMPQRFLQSFTGCTQGSTHGDTYKLQNLSDDALSSMLMSWYMAGYHTGYYQGLSLKSKRNKK